MRTNRSNLNVLVGILMVLFSGQSVAQKLSRSEIKEASKKIPGFEYLVKSNQSYDNGDFTKALEYINIAISKNKNLPDYYHNRAAIFVNLKQLDKAYQDAEMALSFPEPSGIYYNTIATILMEMKNPQQLKKVPEYFEKSLTLDPKQPYTYYNRGLYYLRTKEYDKALSDFQACVSLEPNAHEAFQEMSSVKSMVFHYQQEALIDIEKALSIKKEADYYAKKAVYLFELQQYSESERALENAFKIEKDNKSALLLHARFLEMKGDIAKSIKVLDYLIKEDSTFYGTINNRAMLKTQMNDFEGAIADFRKAMKCDTSEYGIYSNLGLCYIQMQKYKEAIVEFDYCIKKMPDFAFAYNNRGFAKLKLGMTTEALRDVNKSLEMIPDNSYAYKNRALINIETKQWTETCSDLSKAKELNYEILYGNEVNELINKYCKK